jgi:polysaccharide export outer membrane protein
MQRRPRTGGRRSGVRGAMVVALCAALSGCHIFTNGLLDPSQVGSFTNESTLEIRTSLSIQDSPVGIPGATDPQPQDLVPIYQPYRFEVGDVIGVRVFELLASNTETNAQVVVDEIGTVVLPVLGQIRVAGMTREEVTAEIERLLAERGYIREPTVIVEPALRRGNTFVVFGAIAAPNMYPIPVPDTRLLEALNTAGGLVDTVTDIYVIREGDGDGAAAEQVRGKASPSRKDGRLASAAGRDVLLSDGLARPGILSRLRPAEEPKEGGAADKPAASEAELLEAVTRPGEGTTTNQPPASPQARETPRDLTGQFPGGRGGSLPRWVFVNGEWVESDQVAPPGAGRNAGPAPVTEGRPAPRPTVQPEDLDWTRHLGDGESRIIHVSAQGLRDGDYRQNIVVRGGDTIRILAGQIGEYYMMGQVNRPGAYSLTGRQITLKTAIASAGNLAALAWPERCTIYRRYGDREEMHQINLAAIFAGDEPDVLLKNNDLILVGTHPIAPFLAVARSAFRLTYGFGFVYDRNFADIDAYTPQINPSNFPSGTGSRFPNIFR